LTAEQVAGLQLEVRAGAKKATLARKHNVSRETIHRYLRAAKPIASPPFVPKAETFSEPSPVKQKEEEVA
jgi:transposase